MVFNLFVDESTYYEIPNDACLHRHFCRLLETFVDLAVLKLRRFRCPLERWSRDQDGIGCGRWRTGLK